VSSRTVDDQAVGPGALPVPSARTRLVSILGELVHPYGEPVWTSALLTVLRGLGVEDQAARQALSRGAAAGWIESERIGRSARWTLAPRGRGIVEDGIRRRAAFLDDAGEWDGRWFVVFVSVPNAQRSARKRLYGELTWMGLGNPTPGVWLTPHDDEVAGVRELLVELGLDRSAVCFVGTLADAGLYESQIVREAWDLDELQRRYGLLVDRFGALDPAPGDETLLAYLDMLVALHGFLRADPRLPRALQPNWVGREGADLIRRRSEEWSAGAHQRWREIAAAGP
jgi:phenylacetic acid degradation operon negative regulatory protein